MPTKLSLLLVGSADETRLQVERILSDTDYEPQITIARDLPEMRDAVARLAPQLDLILCEQPRESDCVSHAISTLERAGAQIPLLVVSEEHDTKAAVSAINAGASDWIVFHHLQERLVPAIDRAMRDVREHKHAAEVEAALENSRKHYQDLADALPQVVAELDLEGRCTFLNRRGQELFGYTSDDLERRPHITAFIAEDQSELARARLSRVMAGEVFDGGTEYVGIDRDGKRIPVLVYSAPILEGGEIVGVRGVLIDVTNIREAEAQLRASEERYRRLVETMGDGLITLARDGNITFVNQAIEDIFERTTEDVVGRHIGELFDEENAAIVARQLERRFREGVAAVYELGLQTTSGRKLNLLVTATPLRDESGEVVGSLGVITDITHQRAAQENLLRIKVALDNTSDAIGIADANRVPVYLNPSFETMFGWTAEQLRDAGGPAANFAHEEDYLRIFKRLDTDGRFIGEFEGRHASGHIFPVMGRIDAIRDERGEPAGFVAVFTDITRRRQREERRRLNTARLALLNRLNRMLNAGEEVDSIIAVGADGLRDILHAHHVHIFMRTTGETGDELALRYSNMPREAEIRAFGEPLKHANMAMSLKPSSPIWHSYQTGEMVEARESDLPRTVNEIEGFVTPEPLVDGMDLMHTLGVKYICSMPLMRGEMAIGHLTISREQDEPFNDLEKDLLRAFAEHMAVILDKARSEQEITRLNHLLQAIIDNAAVWFSVTDEAEDLIIWNRAAAEISGYPPDEIESSQHLMRMLYPDEDDLREAYDHVAAAFRGEHLEEFETAVTCADGSHRRMAWHLQAFMTADRGQGLVVVGRDVTESRDLQEQLQRVQRMDAVGTLAGGIAHDFNNVLLAIIGHADLLALDAEEGSRARWHAAQISRNSERASRLTRQLLAFSRKQPSRPQVVDLNRLIREMEEMFRRVMPDNIDLQLDLSPDLGYTEIDPSQVEQIVMNLALNARDAMPRGGQLRVTTSNSSLARDRLSELFDAAPGSYVTIQVADTGVGMDEEIEAHIFEPFFTTKQATGGTGLGLSTVYGLVRQNKGAVTVYTEPGEGTLFRVYLPRADTGQPVEAQQDEADQEAVHGDETLLVVEDAENLRELIATILGSFGYTVHTAGMGTEALELERAHRGEIDLVITDVVMPEMAGTELADRLLEVAPELRILFISGYPNDRAISADQDDPRFSFLQKPFSALELGRRVREMLDNDR